MQLHANALMHWRIGLSAAIDVKNIKKSMTSLNTTSHLLMFFFRLRTAYCLRRRLIRVQSFRVSKVNRISVRVSGSGLGLECYRVRLAVTAT